MPFHISFELDTLTCCLNLVKSFQEYVTEGISHPVSYGDLVYKLRRVRCEANFASSGSKIVKRLRRRKYDPLIIERTIGLVLGPSTALYRSFLEHCTLTYKAVGTILRDLSKTPQRRLWEPNRRSNFFSPPANLWVVTYMTEISLIVTLNNQFTLPYLRGDKTSSPLIASRDSFSPWTWARFQTGGA